MNHNLKQIAVSFVLVFFSSVSFRAFSQNQKKESQLNSDSTTVVKTINGFIDAFTNLNWEKFTEFFADDATAFFPPSAKFPSRANNKAEIESIFKKIFDNARMQKSAPPYIVIEPKELKIQIIDDAAIATFVLDDPGSLGRRTIVLKKDNDKWLIVHLHASGIMVSK